MDARLVLLFRSAARVRGSRYMSGLVRSTNRVSGAERTGCQIDRQTDSGGQGYGTQPKSGRFERGDSRGVGWLVLCVLSST